MRERCGANEVGLKSCKDVDSSGNVLRSDCVAKVDMGGLMLTEKRESQSISYNGADGS
jgi:hypothetical protein